jgi:uncharacterized membrane protein YgaE (UPF0421/DUF939 family)
MAGARVSDYLIVIVPLTICTFLGWLFLSPYMNQVLAIVIGVWAGAIVSFVLREEMLGKAEKERQRQEEEKWLKKMTEHLRRHEEKWRREEAGRSRQHEEKWQNEQQKREDEKQHSEQTKDKRTSDHYEQLDIRELYRLAAKHVHPDKGLNDLERRGRNQVMTELNLAYKKGDRGTIIKILRTRK